MARIRSIKPEDPATWADIRPCMTPHHLLYRLYDAAGRLLYIGITWNPKERWKRHRKERPWWGDVRVAAVECHATEYEALTEELAAIKADRPIHNRRGAVA